MDVWSLLQRTAKKIKKFKVFEGQIAPRVPAVPLVTGNFRFPLDIFYHGCPRNTIQPVAIRLKSPSVKSMRYTGFCITSEKLLTALLAGCMS
ncbi:MAG: hypothetical protein BWK76_03245 [Desulfobulbaceae bacterium A2]|nr:MAG: hypothetical protein BWK76_03245 [Desulfobulbaceae bacterium A2]